MQYRSGLLRGRGDLVARVAAGTAVAGVLLQSAVVGDAGVQRGSVRLVGGRKAVVAIYRGGEHGDKQTMCECGIVRFPK